MVDKLKIGVIGAGRWAQKAHLPGFTRSPLSEVVAICDLDGKKARERATEFKIPNVFTNYKDLLF